mmetsp:Transcript_49802/g.122309  ORF Transcript_49802/g.122309 Transcript_49802/m.122309 type:complete len:217 (+) Transcript_49802:267-917(+)
MAPLGKILIVAAVLRAVSCQTTATETCLCEEVTASTSGQCVRFAGRVNNAPYCYLSSDCTASGYHCDNSLDPATSRRCEIIQDAEPRYYAINTAVTPTLIGGTSAYPCSQELVPRVVVTSEAPTAVLAGLGEDCTSACGRSGMTCRADLAWAAGDCFGVVSGVVDGLTDEGVVSCGEDGFGCFAAVALGEAYACSSPEFSCAAKEESLFQVVCPCA